jgi:hypothetical protein
MDKKKARSVRIHEFGGPEVLRSEDVLVTAPSNDPKVVSLVYAAAFAPDAGWKRRIVCPRSGIRWVRF